MNLENKKILASKVFGDGKSRIMFVEPRLDEIKEAITRQDIKDLQKDGAIIIRDVKGRKSKKTGRSRSAGNVRKKINRRKRNYVFLTRKLREYVSELRNQKKLSKEEVVEIRKKIRNKYFRSKNHLKEHLGGIKK